MKRTQRPTCRVQGCTRPTAGGVICADDMAEHAERLADLPLLAHALEDRFLQLQRFSVAGFGSRAEDESPVPFDARAGIVRRRLSRVLLRWCIAFQEYDPLGYPARFGYSKLIPTVEAMTAHLARHSDIIAASALGPSAVNDIRDVHGQALRAVDRPPDLVYLGVCSMQGTFEVDGVTYDECPEDLYAEWGKEHARCRRCKHSHDVKNRQSILLVAVKDQLAGASDIARGLSGLDITVTAERIRKWKERGRIATRHNNLRGEPLYRVGDVIDLVLAERERTKEELRNNQPRKAKA